MAFYLTIHSVNQDRQTVLSTLSLVEAGVGARVAQVLPAYALDVEAPEAAVVRLQRLEALRRHRAAARRKLQEARALVFVEPVLHHLPPPPDDAMPLPEANVLAQVLCVPPPVRHVDRCGVGVGVVCVWCGEIKGLRRGCS